MEMNKPATSVDRALQAYHRANQREVKREEKLARERAEAMVQTLPELLESMSEQERKKFFFQLEDLASKANRRKIATHPRRPKSVDALHAEAEAKSAAMPEREEA